MIIGISYIISMFNKSENLKNDDYYLSDEGYKVFTEKYLLKRGYCCLNNCKHCPYGYDKNTGEVNKRNKTK